jgi:hypothetical protein
MAEPTLQNRTPNLGLRYSDDTHLNLNWGTLDDAWGKLLAGEIEFPIGDNVFITNNLHVGGDVQIDGDIIVNGTAIFHGPVTFDGPTVTILNDFYVLGDSHLHNLFVDEITINPGGHFNCGGQAVIASDCIISLDWVKLYNIPDIIQQIITNNGMAGPAGGDLMDTYPNPHLIPSGVTAGLYGDAANIPRLTVDAKGRITNVSLVPFTGGGGGGTPLGPASGDLTGTYPGPFLITLSPPVPAGTWGGPAAIPQVTVDGKGRVTHATQNVIRPGRDGMTRILKLVPDPDVSAPVVFWDPNTRHELLSQQFTPIATGRGVYTGVFNCWTYRTGTISANHVDPTVINVYFYLDGILKHTITRNWLTWTSNWAGGPPWGETHIAVPFWFPWTASLNTTHQISIQVSNYDNPSEAITPSYVMVLMNEWTELGIEEDSEPGIGTNSSYLLSAAAVGASTAGVIGSWEAAYAFTLPAGLPGSWATSKVAGTASFDIQVNGVSVGQIVWSAGTVAGYTFPSPVAVNVGDRIEVIANAGVTDPTLTLRGIL